MRSLALADVTESDLATLLAENETLFVEHKAGLGGEGYQVAKAICSFANTLGGWVLIGVAKGRPSADEVGGWTPVAAHELTDRIRQALQMNKVDPIPPFAATVLSAGQPAKPLGVVRVYESADTPHVMGNGQVFVRSVAEDSDAGRKYRAGGVETQAVLLALAERGRGAAERAKQKLHPDVVPLAASVVGLSRSTVATEERGCVGIRAVPLTGVRLVDWAVSQDALGVLEPVARTLARCSDSARLEVWPSASGLIIRAKAVSLLGDEDPQRDGVATTATDAAGVVAAALRFGIWTPPREKTVLTLNGFRDLIVVPLLKAVASILEGAEAYGRVLLELRVGALEDVLELNDEGGRRPVPRSLPVGGEIMLPLVDRPGELNAIAGQWRSDVGRATGYLTLRP